MQTRQGVRRILSRVTRHGKLVVVLFSAGSLLGPLVLWAHHGLAQFDTKHPVKLQGTVTEFQWINPHAYIFADVKDEKGKVTNWKLELGSLGMLTRFGGWSLHTVKPGDQITFDGFRAKDGSPYMSLATVQLPDGKVLSAAP